VKLLEEIGIPELTEEQIEALSETAEKTARDYVQSKVPQQKISVLDIVVEAAGSRPVTVSVDIDLKLSPAVRTYSAEKLVNEATERAFRAVEEKLRELDCRSKK
jgi:acid phosphatase class B